MHGRYKVSAILKLIGALNDRILLGQDGLFRREPRLTARAIETDHEGRSAVMYAGKFKRYSLTGGGVEAGEDVLTALRREIREETGYTCDEVQVLGIVAEMTRLINDQTVDHTRGKYLKMRDVLALRACAAHL